jgi:hypothetical protein
MEEKGNLMAFSCTIGNHHYRQQDSECEGVFWSIRKNFQHAQWGHFSFFLPRNRKKRKIAL